MERLICVASGDRTKPRVTNDFGKMRLLEGRPFHWRQLPGVARVLKIEFGGVSNRYAYSYFCRKRLYSQFPTSYLGSQI